MSLLNVTKRSNKKLSWHLTLLVLMLAVGLVLTGCGQKETPQDTQTTPDPQTTENPELKDAEMLWQIAQDETYQDWSRAPGYETRQPAKGPHGQEVDIFVNEILDNVLKTGGTVTAWPAGSIIIKDAFINSNIDSVVIMEKLENGNWYYAKYSPDGTPSAAGENFEMCMNCHKPGADSVLAFGFPN